MPRAVKKSVLGILQAQGKAASETAAEKRWDDLEKEGRIREEVWG